MIHTKKIIKSCAVRLSFLSLVAALLTVGCSEEKHEPIGVGTTAPGKVTNVVITPTPGGSDLNFTFPNDADLLYVEAELTTPEGRKMNFKTSSQKSSLEIKGLSTTKQQEVLLYSVNKAGLKSEPVSIKINPLTPPYIAAFESMRIAEGLGGVDAFFENETTAELSFYIGRYVDGKFVEDKFINTKRPKGPILFWGYPHEEQTFGVFVRDRWDNYSDTITATLTPIEEMMLDKKLFKGYLLDNDGVRGDDSTYDRMENLWDGLWSLDFNKPHDGNGVGWRNYHVQGTVDKPGAFTIDLGQNSQISRIHVAHYYPYTTHAPKKYEIYGLFDYFDNLITPGMGAWHHWTLITEAENFRPSENGGTVEEDAEVWPEGDVLVLTSPTEAVRYIRFKSVESWNGKVNFSAAEITVYGRSVNE